MIVPNGASHPGQFSYFQMGYLYVPVLAVQSAFVFLHSIVCVVISVDLSTCSIYILFHLCLFFPILSLPSFSIPSPSLLFSVNFKGHFPFLSLPHFTLSHLLFSSSPHQCTFCDALSLPSFNPFNPSFVCINFALTFQSLLSDYQ